MAPVTTVTSSKKSEDGSELPIRQRGRFLHDHFFQDSREHFSQAMNKVLNDWEEDNKISDWHSSRLTDWDENIFSDRLKRYRTLRKDHSQTNEQAVKEINDEHQYKIVLDVREYMQGSLKTSFVGERELLVEGSIEEKTSGVKGKRTFEKRFQLPCEAIISSTKSTLSSDGILTIISPKKVVKKERQEYMNEASSNNQMNQNKKTALNQKHSIFSDHFRDECLPISRRGHFFSDSIFKDEHEDFNRAVKDVLKRWNEPSEDELVSYRNLRSRSLKEDNQAVTETDNHQFYKIVIDVHGFVNDGEVSIKVVDDKYLEVEGCIDKDEKESKCKKTFKRRFTIPRNTNVKDISSLLSSDGVLSITLPKQGEQTVSKETIIPVKLESSSKKESSGSNLETKTNKSSVNNQNKTEAVAAKICMTENKSNSEREMTKEMKKNINNEVIIPVTMDGNDDKMEHQNMKSENKIAETEAGPSQVNIINIKMEGIGKDNLSKDVASYKENSSAKCEEKNSKKALIHIEEPSDNSSDSDSDVSEATSVASYIPSHDIKPSYVSMPSENDTPQQKHTNINTPSHKVSEDEYIIPVKIEMAEEVLKNDSIHNRAMKVKENIYTQVNDANVNTKHEQNDSNGIPIVRRGPFYTDSYFNGLHKQFENAVQNVIQKSGLASRKNDLDFYRSLRKRSNSEQNQANGCTEDETSFKIVVDVHDFKNSDIKIKVHNANELTVEGEQHENQNQTSIKRKFCRKFIFPNHINCDAVTSAVSEEGVLTINAPKKIKENCKEVKSDESVKSILISHDSNHELNSSTEQNGKGKDNKESVYIQSSPNNETIKSVNDSVLYEDEDAQTLPITRRGPFFTDPYFEDSRLILNNTIKEVIGKSGSTSKDDDFSFYRSLLDRSNNKDNQTGTITECDNIYKLVLDIQGFSAEEVKTKFLSSTELVLEATTEKKEEGSSLTRHFRRCFVFPNSVNVEAVTTSLSSDGILTISAPKKILGEKRESGSSSKDVRKHINLNNGWEDEKTHQTSSERDGVRSKSFSKTKSSFHTFTNSQ
ncbi:unnamed protein product [Meganyctiphanes norvegica]|uniref:SHSP domain-containing protein n=1 Tax=Meganyctiphanes norvegica TaxID=48144 RepID=A0AAV2RTQ9_MEGNR